MSGEEPNAMDKLLNFLEQLGKAKISYDLISVRDAIMVVVTVPGERWEVEFFGDSHVEVERFISTGNIEAENVLSSLVAAHQP